VGLPPGGGPVRVFILRMPFIGAVSCV